MRAKKNYMHKCMERCLAVRRSLRVHSIRFTSHVSTVINGRRTVQTFISGFVLHELLQNFF